MKQKFESHFHETYNINDTLDFLDNLKHSDTLEFISMTTFNRHHNIIYFYRKLTEETQ